MAARPFVSPVDDWEDVTEDGLDDWATVVPSAVAPAPNGPQLLPPPRSLMQRAKESVLGTVNQQGRSSTMLGEIVNPIFDERARKAPARGPLEAPPLVDFGALGTEDLVPGKVPKGIVQGVADVATSITTPLNAGIMMATGGLGLIANPVVRSTLQRLVSAGFSMDMMKSALDQSPEFVRQAAEGEWQEAARTLTGIGGSAAFSALAAKHAMAPNKQPPPRVQRTYADDLAEMTNEQLAAARKSPPSNVTVAQVKNEIATRERRGEWQTGPTGQLVNRAQRRAAAEVPQTGEREQRTALVDPKLEEISQSLGLGEFEKLAEPEMDVVRKLRDEGTSPASAGQVPTLPDSIPWWRREKPAEDVQPEAATGSRPPEPQVREEVIQPSVNDRLQSAPAQVEPVEAQPKELLPHLSTGARDPKYLQAIRAFEKQNPNASLDQVAEALASKFPDTYTKEAFAEFAKDRMAAPNIEQSAAEKAASVEVPAETHGAAAAKAIATLDLTQLETRYPRAGKAVDGRTVRGDVPNTDSISAEFTDYNELPGIREVALSDFEAPPNVTKRTKALAEEIRNSGEVNPLIVAIDEGGPYILEGGHRYDALKILGAKSFPAVVVRDAARNAAPAPSSPATKPPVEPVAKEPWQMTREEYENVKFNTGLALNLKRIPEVRELNEMSRASYDKMFGRNAARALPELLEKAKAAIDREFGVGAGDAYLESHQNQVRAALKSGKPVPPEVLAEYPDLKPESRAVIPASPLAEAVAPANRLDAAERTIQERIQKRYKEAASTLSAGPGLAAEQLADYAALGAVKLAKGAVKFAQWSEEMILDIGESVRPHLQRIWAESRKMRQQEANRPPMEQAQGGHPASRPSTSPSYDRTKPKILEHVSPDIREAMGARLLDFEKRNPERQVVSFADILEEARSLDPAIVAQLDKNKLKVGETLDPAVRFAARETLNGLNQEIESRRKAFAEKVGQMSDKERLAETQQIETMDRDARRLVDVLIPTRSQDGRNLTYHRMMAQQSFDVTHWLSRAKRAMVIPENVDLPETVAADIKALTANGATAEAEAVRVVTRKATERKAREEAEAEVKAEVEREQTTQDPKTLTREEVVERKRKEIIGRLKSAIKGEETSTTDPIMPEERLEFKQDPEILTLRGKLARIVEEKRKLAEGEFTRDKAVEQARQRFLSRLKAKAKGQIASADPVSPMERNLWDADAEVIELRAKIAANRPAPPPPPNLSEKMAHYKERVLARIAEKMTGTEKVRAPSKWELTPEERALVDNDPQVKHARIELARRMQKLEKLGILDTITAYRRAGLLTGMKTHLRNIGGNTAFQALEEVNKAPAVIVDAVAAPVFAKIYGHQAQRTIQGPSWKALKAAGREASTRGVRELLEIMREGQTEEQLAQFDLVKEPTGNSIFDKAARTVFRSMSAGDRVFKVFAYERSLQEQTALAKIPREAATEKMKIQAWENAQYATFNNKNEIARLWSDARGAAKRRGPAGKALAFGMDMLVPFANTPANLVSRVFDYSVVGVPFRAGTALMEMKKHGWSPEQQREFSLAISRGMTGSALMGLGYWLWSNGMLTGLRKDEPGKRAIEEAGGRMPGSFLAGGKWRKIDSVSPIGNTLILGAMVGEENAGSKGIDLVGTIGVGALKTVAQQPMLQGVTDLTEALGQKGLSAKAKSFAASTAGSFVPTVVSDVASVGDAVRRDARGEGLLDAVGKGISKRVPGLRNTLPEKRDVLGDVEKEVTADEPFHSIGGTVLRRMADPTIGTAAKELSDPVMREMIRTGVSMAYGKKREGESTEAYNQRQVEIGQGVRKAVGSLIGTGKYQAADRETQQEMIEDEIGRTRTMDSAKRKKSLSLVERNRAWRAKFTSGRQAATR